LILRKTPLEELNVVAKDIPFVFDENLFPNLPRVLTNL
jgi:hypothetical protein